MLNNLLNFTKTTSSELKFNIYHPNAMHELAMSIRSFTHEMVQSGKEIVVVCIGTDRSTGDSLGPLTGTKLKTLNPRLHVYGTLDEPVHATNLIPILNYLEETYPGAFIFAVDACLGKLENVGCISLGHGSVKPGAAVNKELPPVGNAYITGVVNVGGFMEHMVLQSTRLNLVFKMADTIAHGLSFGLQH